MPNAPKTPLQRFRLDTDVWERFGELVGRRERSRVLREFVCWYVGVKGAKLPRRPKTAVE